MSWRLAALPFGVLYLILVAARFRGIVAGAYRDADVASAPMIAQLFGAAPASAHVVLGEFGWYATLLFELATKWLSFHRQIWETAGYAMSLAGAALTAVSVRRLAGALAAGLTAVLLICASPDMLHLAFSLTQHTPDWFCLALLAAFLVLLLERRGTPIRTPLAAALALVVGVIVGVNAASDPIVVITGLAPFALATAVVCVLAPGPATERAGWAAVGLLLVAGAAWAATAVVMSALSVAPEPGLQTTALASTGKIGANFRLWWQSIALLGNGSFFARRLTFDSGLAIVCAALSLGAVVLLPVAGWRFIRGGVGDRTARGAPARLAWIVFWCSSALLLSAAFLLSSAPVDVHSDRYLIGLVYAVAAVIPVVSAGRAATQAAAVAGTCLFALSGVLSLASGVATRNTEGFPSAALAGRIAEVAAADHLKIGYSGYWDAAPITWASHLRILVYPVSICDRGAHLCRFDLHYISSWYTARPHTRSFLLTDRRLRLVPAPTPDLGRPLFVHHIGQITMYVYPYDLAARLAPS